MFSYGLGVRWLAYVTSSGTEKVILISLCEKATAAGTRNNVRSSAISLSLQGI